MLVNRLIIEDMQGVCRIYGSLDRPRGVRAVRKAMLAGVPVPLRPQVTVEVDAMGCALVRVPFPPRRNW